MTRLLRAISFAWSGLREALATQPNFRIQLGLAGLVFVFGRIVGLQPVEWAVVALTVALVLMIELVNTVIETVVNMVTTRQDARAKFAKDASAAAVLVAGLASLVVGWLLVGQRFIRRFW